MSVQSIFSNRCWLEEKLQPATVSFENGMIKAIYKEKISGAEDVGDHILMPGIIDAHVHINEPGRTDWEGFETATMAAAAGGITTIIDMPLNASPVTTSVAALHEKLISSENKLHVNVGFYGGLIPGNYPDLEGLMRAGVLGIKCFLVHSGIDEFPNVGEAQISEAMPLIAKYNIPLLAHCEIYDEEIQQGVLSNPGSYNEYLLSRPKQWENDAINLMISLCRKHGCPVHIVHVSSAESLKFIESARAAGLPVTAETCPHYIYFNAEEIPDRNTLYKCAPPIREEANNALLKKALATGVLDFLTTDHSPAPPQIKEIDSGNLQTAWGGIAGLQFLLPVSWTSLKETMPLEKFIPLLTEHPATFLKIADRKGKIKVGFDADLLIWNPEEEWEIKSESILHRHRISPYIGKHLYGSTIRTIVNGVTVYNKRSVINNAVKAGKIILNKSNAGFNK